MKVEKKKRQSTATSSARRNGNGRLNSGGMSSADRSLLEVALRDAMTFVANDQFSDTDAEEHLFSKGDQIPLPNTSWYGSVMSRNSKLRPKASNGSFVLTAEQEQLLFLRFNYARFRVAGIQDVANSGKITNKQSEELVYWYRRAKALRDQIAQTSLSLVLAMAKRVRILELEFADLVSEGNLALLLAIDKFDVSRGFKFSTYACRAILMTFNRSRLKHTKHRRLFCAIPYEPIHESSDQKEQKYEEQQRELVETLRDIVQCNKADLTDVEREVINHRFAIQAESNGDTEGPLTLEDVGKMVGLTRERVRQIQKNALRKIRRAMEQQDIEASTSVRRLVSRVVGRRVASPVVIALSTD